VKKSELCAVWLSSIAVLSGCVSTTTGTPAPVADERDASELNYQLGARYYQNGNYELARDRLLLATQLDPKMAVAYTTLAMTYEALGNLRLATEAYENAIRIAPRDFDVNNAYAVFLCKHRNYENSSKYFLQAADHPENDNAERTLTNAGLCMLNKPDMAEAERFFRAALELRPTYGEALLQMCLLKYRQQDFMSARAFLQRLMASSKPTAGVLLLAAEIEGKLGNERGRSEFVDQLLNEFPESPEARKVLSSG
jgi:type IV pilus assembly protein PilF